MTKLITQRLHISLYIQTINVENNVKVIFRFKFDVAPYLGIYDNHVKSVRNIVRSRLEC